MDKDKVDRDKVDRDNVDKDKDGQGQGGVSSSISRTFLELRSSYWSGHHSENMSPGSQTSQSIVAKCHGFGGFIRVKNVCRWGKKFGKI